MATFMSPMTMESGEAIALTDMFEEPSRLMEQTTLNDIFTENRKQHLHL